MSVSLRTVRLVAAKELRESLRDKRTLFVALLLPVLLYPLMMLAVGPLVGMQRERLREDVQPVALSGLGAPALRRLVFDPPPEPAPESSSLGLAVVESKDPRADLAEGRIALWIEVGEGFADALDGGGTASVVVHRDGSDDKSLTAAAKLDAALARASEEEMKRRVRLQGLPPQWRVPIQVTPDDVASPERRAAFLFGKALAFILVVLTLSSSFYPAVDAVAGEKERGTMETLLVAPCGRTELVLGKFVAVLAVTVAAASLNLASMALTFGPIVGFVAPQVGTGLQVTPGVLAGVLALLVPLSALFCAASLALSTLARSVKEGQHYLTPLFLVVMPLAMVVILPNVPLTAALAPVPVTNAVLFFRDLLLGKTEWATAAIVLVTTFAYAAAALWGAVSLFLREETLFRGPEGGTRILARPAPRETPGGAAALTLFLVAIAIIWYGQRSMPKEVVPNVLVTQFGVILAPCLLLALWIRARASTTFRLGPPPWMGVASAAAIGLAMPVVNTWLLEALGIRGAERPELREFGRQMEAFVEANPAGALLLIGALPAVCEELFFRGFLLSGFGSAFRGRLPLVRAALLTAALFALFHIFPERWLPTFTMGLVLAALVVRTGSLWPAILAHALNNSTAVLQAWPPYRDALARVDPAWVVAGSFACLALGLAALVATRARPGPPA